eukprot:CAMPEP_0119267266 /NCGR_PEP_ID=MMETSP1329-20130426/5480_1 /TAXON_ID=114041 /ORGANISM="Genus nov. species nov., Strain RCC1024" /LENGTH=93 /DNA_ID=CAMNT_0007267183 /DNA_START=363 /DNA_END=640 /DNA_ORIENTATION=-
MTEPTEPPPRSGCWAELDTLYTCATPRHQFTQIYRLGQFDDCGRAASAMWACMRGGEARRKFDAEAPAAEAPATPWELKETPCWESDGSPARA